MLVINLKKKHQFIVVSGSLSTFYTPKYFILCNLNSFTIKAK